MLTTLLWVFHATKMLTMSWSGEDFRKVPARIHNEIRKKGKIERRKMGHMQTTRRDLGRNPSHTDVVHRRTRSGRALPPSFNRLLLQLHLHCALFCWASSTIYIRLNVAFSLLIVLSPSQQCVSFIPRAPCVVCVLVYHPSSPLK